jgi:hypothetical protein
VITATGCLTPLEVLALTIRKVKSVGPERLHTWVLLLHSESSLLGVRLAQASVLVEMPVDLSWENEVVLLVFVCDGDLILLRTEGDLVMMRWHLGLSCKVVYLLDAQGCLLQYAGT